MKAHRTTNEMDCWARNERLYRHLLSMGLVVQPVFVGRSKTKIDHLRVSAGTQLSDFVACLSKPTASDATGGCTLLPFKLTLQKHEPALAWSSLHGFCFDPGYEPNPVIPPKSTIDR